MYVFLSFVMAFIAIYYLDMMADSHNPDTTYTTPLVALLIYSVLSIARSFNNFSFKKWLYGDYDYDNREYYSSQTRYDNEYYNGTYSNRINRNESVYTRNNNEQTEYFAKDKEKERTYTKELVHYPTKGEVREKIQELKKNRWFRIKCDFCNIFGYDLTEKYRKNFQKPLTTTSVHTVKSVGKEDNSRYMPNNDWLQRQRNEEMKEYNIVTKHMGRSFEISFAEIENGVQ